MKPFLDEDPCRKCEHSRYDHGYDADDGDGYYDRIPDRCEYCDCDIFVEEEEKEESTGK